MTTVKARLTPVEEHSFWLEILEDHARFIRDYLSSEEAVWVKTAQEYILRFQALRTRLASFALDVPVNSPDLILFSRNAHATAWGYYQFEGHMQRLRILNEVNLNLTPTYLIGTLNENAEYLRRLHYYVKGLDSPDQPLTDLLDLWLEDQLGHAALLRNGLDPVELALAGEAAKYMEAFNAHMLKNNAIKRYLRFLPPGFPEQLGFVREVGRTVMGFNQLVDRVIQLHKVDQVLGRLTLRFLEHHIPESCYFLRKLASFSPAILLDPNCPLTKPSF
ncbi:DUF2935 domain-containing protein [Ammoniphilus sp. YIM 78166]|uniref:DUF2935 domain-containing protein n=1 Tax=Ammoniphilus sp. YIM 78166 TaxID=1644106 RepID=UPI00106F65FC|nr:DUF2935 domain-containing protein [Ammoniphilus sp. YIM 78166]